MDSRDIAASTEGKRAYEMSEEEHKALGKRFVYHSPKEYQPVRYETIRQKGYELASLLMVTCPRSRELSLALTKLEEVVMWANAAIARNE